MERKGYIGPLANLELTVEGLVPAGGRYSGGFFLLVLAAAALLSACAVWICV